MALTIIIIQNTFEAPEGADTVIRFTGEGFGEILVSQATMKNMVGAFWKGFWKGEDGCIDFVVEGKGVHCANRIYGEPVTAYSNILKMVELFHGINRHLSDLVNRTECKCSCGTRMAMLRKYVP